MPKVFGGLPAGRIAVTPVPNVLFSELLPEMDDLAEAQVTLHIFYLLTNKKGASRYVSLSELRSDVTLMGALNYNKQELKRALGRAVARGSLLRVISGDEEHYFFNTASSRRYLEQIENGEIQIAPAGQRAEPAAARPNIFKLYEQNIGSLTPIIVEELKEAEQEYPPEQIERAFKTAVEQNKRSWAYVHKVLVNWARASKHPLGIDDEKSGRDSKKRRKPLFQGKFADRVKQNKQ